jgi:copper(I)-binding protein
MAASIDIAYPALCSALAGAWVLMMPVAEVPRASAAPAGVTVSDSWFRYITPNVPAGGYMRITNQSSRTVVLTGTSSPGCGMMMMHRTEAKGGSDRMVEVERVQIPSKRSVVFSPGGFHLMCMQPRMSPGQTVDVTLTLNGGQTVTAPFTVFGAGGKPQARLSR